MPSQNRTEKEELVGKLKTEFSSAQAAITAHYSGIDVRKITVLRRQLRDKQVAFRIIKNTLSRLAVDGTPMAELKEDLKGPIALAYTNTDAIAMAKALTDFAKAEKHLVIQSGVLDGVRLEKAQVEALAEIPSREELLARLAGSLQAPYAGFVYALSGLIRKLVYALDAVRRKKEEEGAK